MNVVLAGLARERALVVVVSVAVRVWTGAFKHGGVICGPVRALACFGGVMGSGTTILVGVESVTSGITSNDLTAVGAEDLEFGGTLAVDVGGAFGLFAAVLASVAVAVNRFDRSHTVVSVNQRNVIIVNVSISVQSDFNQSNRRSTTGTVTFDLVATVTSVAMVVLIFVTPSPGPEPSCPVAGSVQTSRFALSKFESAIGQVLFAWVALDTDPDWTSV